MIRDIIKNASTVVIKIGSRVLLEDSGRLNYPTVAHLVEQMAVLKARGKKIIFVTSGAIGAGMEALSLTKRPSDLPTLQAAAAIGQVRLMRAYEDLFDNYGYIVGQVLLTRDDLTNRARHVNIKHTLHALLERDVIPIINENDTVSVDEIKFGDNDVLASLVAMLLEVKALVLLTTSQGFMITNNLGQQERLDHILELNPEVLQHIEKHKIGLSVGGMESKLKAAANMIHVGGLAVIAPGRENNALRRIFEGDNIGTVVGEIIADRTHKMPGRKRWIAFYKQASGHVIVDDGAKLALCTKGKSLLAVGIISVHGSFDSGSVIDIRDLNNQRFAKGIAKFSAQEIDRVKKQAGEEIVHRDDLVVF